MRIGIGVGADQVRAVGILGDTVAFAVAAEVQAGDVGAALLEVLRRVPRSSRRGARLIVAVGPAHAHVRCITGLPPAVEPATAAAILRENTRRFFLGNAGSLATSSVVRESDGRLWAAAFDAELLESIERACRTARRRITRVVATASVLGHATQTTALCWPDGAVGVECALIEGHLVAARRHRTTAVPNAPPPAHPHLARLDADAWRFADAFGAAACEPATVPAWTPLPVRVSQPVSRARFYTALAVAAMGFTTVAVAPIVGAALAEREAAAELASLAPAARAAAVVAAQLSTIHAAVAQVERFDQRRSGLTPLLADLAQALPDSAAITSLRVDSSGVLVAVVSRRAEAVLAAIDRLARIESPEVVGPVTRERVGPSEMERSVIRFRERTSR